MSILTIVILCFSLLGAFDKLIGNKLGLGKEFERGFELFAPMVFSMVGMLILAPALGVWLSPVFEWFYNAFNIDPSIIPASLFANDIYFELARSIGEFKDVVLRAAEENAPSVIAKYLLGLAQIFNKFYSNVKINVSEEAVRNTNFLISHATRIVINEGLRLLGMEYVEQM